MASEFPTIVAKSPVDSHGKPQSNASTSDRSSSYGSADLESLPNEVLVNIMRNGGTENVTSMARTMCPLSKRLEPVARKELYRAIAINNRTVLRKLITTLTKKPEFGEHMVELELLVRRETFPDLEFLVRRRKFPETTKATFVLFLQYFEVLKRSSNLRRLAIMLGDYPGTRRSKRSTCQRLIEILSDALLQSQRSGAITAVLPRLEKLTLIDDAYVQFMSSYAGVAPEFFTRFLDLPSLLSLECIGDSGSWGNSVSVQPTGPGTNVSTLPNYQKTESVVLRRSHSDGEDLIDLIDMFPGLKVLFVQAQFRSSVFVHNPPDTRYADDHHAYIQRSSTTQQNTNQSERRYLSDSFKNLQYLETLAYVPHRPEWESPNEMPVFLGPSKYLSLKRLCNLTSLSVLINVFASPNGSSTGRLTVSPVEVLPKSLRSLRLVVDHNTGQEFSGAGTHLHYGGFQSRVAALEFMEQLASICPTEFPRLRQAEYIWAVGRHTQASAKQGRRRRRPFGDFWFPEVDDISERHCDGSNFSLCCDLHARLWALSPRVDSTSLAAGIISPFRARFDSLKIAFNNVDVTFEVIELEQYDDFFFHWRGG